MGVLTSGFCFSTQGEAQDFLLSGVQPQVLDQSGKTIGFTKVNGVWQSYYSEPTKPVKYFSVTLPVLPSCSAGGEFLAGAEMGSAVLAAWAVIFAVVLIRRAL